VSLQETRKRSSVSRNSKSAREKERENDPTMMKMAGFFYTKIILTQNNGHGPVTPPLGDMTVFLVYPIPIK
jgi:hypothetical protein